MTAREVAEEEGISRATCYEILTKNLGVHRVAAKSVLCLLSEDQTWDCVDVSQELVDRANADENFSKNRVTGGET